MPKSLQQRLDHADALVDVFENYEPRSEDQRDAAPHRALVAAVEQRADADRAIVGAVAALRDAQFSWAYIGAYLGTSGQAAQQRYGGRASG
ncbi:MAG: hypothetical protein V4531_11765 [Actinomycetota bacterium]